MRPELSFVPSLEGETRQSQIGTRYLLGRPQHGHARDAQPGTLLPLGHHVDAQNTIDVIAQERECNRQSGLPGADDQNVQYRLTVFAPVRNNPISLRKIEEDALLLDASCEMRKTLSGAELEWWTCRGTSWHRRRGQGYPAFSVVGSIILRISVIFVAGNPLISACLRMICSSTAR
jgi:hypothetical protein